MRAVAQKSGGYLSAGRVLLATDTRQSFELQLQGRDRRMLEAFRHAGYHWRDTPEMARSGTHSPVVHLIGHGGSRTHMPRRSWRPPRGLIKAGGPGAKVEGAGVAHSPRTWLELASTTLLFSACRPYVVCVAGGKDVYACGMHHLGLRDAIIDASVTDEPATLLADFTKFVFTHAAQIRPGQTFQSGPGKPRLRMQEDAGAPYEPGDLFGNPYGTWRLRPA